MKYKLEIEETELGAQIALKVDAKTKDLWNRLIYVKKVKNLPDIARKQLGEMLLEVAQEVGEAS